MKKTVLLFACAMSFYAANAQVTLSSSPYVQNFDLLGAGTPTGWSVYHAATATSLGTLDAVNTLDGLPSMLRPDTSCAGLVLVGGFKNFPSATVAGAGDNWCSAPPSYSNRAMGVRQVSPSNPTHPDLDPGAAFAVELANTTGLSNFNLTFKLQSLDTSSPRVSTWTVDYGIGASPSSFTAASTGSSVMTTGGNTFSNNTVTATFPAAINNQSGPVWIRIVCLSGSSGSGNRPSNAIDDFSLSFNSTTGVNNINATGNMTLNVLGNPSTSTINFNCATEEAGQYTLTLCDMSGRSVYSENVQLAAGGQAHTVNTNLAAGIYIARLSNGSTVATAKVVVQ